MTLPACLTTVTENGVCGLSNITGSHAFPVRAGLAFKDPVAGKWIVWLWDVFDAGVGMDNSGTAEDSTSFCMSLADAGFTSNVRPTQRTIVLTLNPPRDGNHATPIVAGTPGMAASYYEQGELSSGVGASAGTFDVTSTAQCVTGPLSLTFPWDAGGLLTGSVSVPFCGPQM